MSNTPVSFESFEESFLSEKEQNISKDLKSFEEELNPFELSFEDLKELENESKSKKKQNDYFVFSEQDVEHSKLCVEIYEEKQRKIKIRQKRKEKKVEVVEIKKEITLQDKIPEVKVIGKCKMCNKVMTNKDCIKRRRCGHKFHQSCVENYEYKYDIYSCWKCECN